MHRFAIYDDIFSYVRSIFLDAIKTGAIEMVILLYLRIE